MPSLRLKIGGVLSRRNDGGHDEEYQRAPSNGSSCSASSSCSSADNRSSPLVGDCSVGDTGSFPEQCEEGTDGVRVVCSLPYNYTFQHGSYTGQVDANTMLPHGMGTWRSTSRSATSNGGNEAAPTLLEGQWSHGRLYHKHGVCRKIGDGDSLLMHGLQNIVEHAEEEEGPDEDADEEEESSGKFWTGRVKYSWGETELGYSFWEDE